MIPKRPARRPSLSSSQAIRRLYLGTALLLATLACAAPAGAGEEIAATTSPCELSSAASQLAIALSPEARARLAHALTQAGPGAVALRFEGVRTASQPGGYYEIYLDLPAPPARGGEEVPAPSLGPESPHYAGNLSLFGLGPEPGGGGGVQDLPIAQAIRRLREGGLWWEEELTLTFIPRGAPGSVKIERVALTVD